LRQAIARSPAPGGGGPATFGDAGQGRLVRQAEALLDDACSRHCGIVALLSASDKMPACDDPTTAMRPGALLR
jgi:hypothetical protein